MSFMLQLCLTLTGGAGLVLQTGGNISRNTQEVITLEYPLLVGPAKCPLWVRSEWIRGQVHHSPSDSGLLLLSPYSVRR
jgi:hypothetical protein